MRSVFTRFFPVALLLACAAFPAAAYFERLEVGGRALALGHSYHAIADDPSAIYWNPAGLAQAVRPAVLFDYYKPFVVQDLASGFAAVSYPGAGGQWGAAWHYFGLSGVERENVFSLAYAARTILPRFGTLAVGVTGKVMSVSYSSIEDRPFLDTSPTNVASDYGGQTEATADVGFLYNPIEKVALGVIVRNVVEPRFDFVSGGGGTTIAREVEGALAYRWDEASLLTAGLAKTSEGYTAISIGGEVVFYDVFALRSGVFDAEFWGGFGLISRRWSLDSAFVTDRNLGISYMASMTIFLGGGDE